MKDLPQIVYVVDDDDAVRDSLRLLLKSAGLACEVFGAAQEFLGSYDPAQPGCLVLDVRIATRPTDAGDVEVSVSDLGPGLAGEVEQKIFEPFFTTKPTGTGLGLAISRSIIKAHEARLGYRANQPRGACFYFVLPAHMEMPR